MNPYPGMVFDPVTRSYRLKEEEDAYMAIQRVHEANVEKQEVEGYQTFSKPPLGGKEFCKCGSKLTGAEKEYYGHSCERCEEKDHESMEADIAQAVETHKEEILLARNIESDLHQAIERVYDMQKFLRSLHPDVKKIINFGELLNEPH